LAVEDRDHPAQPLRRLADNDHLAEPRCEAKHEVEIRLDERHASDPLSARRDQRDHTALDAGLGELEAGLAEGSLDPILREPELAVEALAERPLAADLPVDEVVDLDGLGLVLEEARQDRAVVGAHGNESIELERLTRQVAVRDHESPPGL